MNKIPEDELMSFIKKYNLCHFKKVNLIGASNVGKKTLLSYIRHFSDSQNDFEIKEKTDNLNEEKNSLLVEIVKKITVPYYDTKKLNINLFISNIDDLELIKNNLETLLSKSECVIFMLDISSAASFSLISELIPLIYNQMKKNIEYGQIPLFFLTNKIDLEQERQVSGFEIKELIDKYENIKNYEISLNLKKNESDDNINEFIIKLCTTISESDKKYSFVYDCLNLVNLREPMMISNNNDESLKKTDSTLNFLLLGSQTVGKTSFAQKLINNSFSENTIATLGIDIIRTVGELYGNLVKIELWDTAGQERLRSIPKKYYSKGDGFLLLFDVTDRSTFDDITGWIKDIRSNRGTGDQTNFEQRPSDEVLFLIGNKIDNYKNRKVTKEEGESFAKKYNVKYFEISCKLGINIYEIFCDVIFEASSHNRRESTNFVIQNRKKSLYNPPKKKCC